MPKNFYYLLAGLVALAALGVGLIIADPADGSGQNYGLRAFSEANARVLRVVDGDTLVAKIDKLDDEVTVRLLGINAPESVDPRRPVECFGKEASNKLRELLPPGAPVRLEADEQADERDKYQRLLRNVFLADGTDVNAWLVKEGYAHAYLSFPLTAERKQELRKLEEEAKKNKRGLWGENACGL